MKKALFIAYGGGHITMVAPVIKELQARGVECAVLALTTGYRKATQLGLKPLGYRDFKHLATPLDDVVAWGRQLYADNQHPDVDPFESLLYLGINFAQWVSDYGEDQARVLYATRGRRGFYPLEFMHRVLKEVQPDIVVSTNSPRTEQAAIEAASGLSIPTLSMLDLFLTLSDPFCHRLQYADRLTVISEDVKKVLLTLGIDSSRVAVTGNPAFDTLASTVIAQQAAELRRRLGWTDQKVILFAGHAEELPQAPSIWRGRQLCIDVEAKLSRWIAQHEDHALIVRYHPSEAHLYPASTQHARIYRSDPSIDPLHPVLLSSNIVVVQTSTVGLEASLAGRSVLCLKYAPSVQAAAYNYADLGLASAINSPADLINRLSSTIELPRVDPSDFCVGRSAALVCAQVLELLQG